MNPVFSFLNVFFDTVCIHIKIGNQKICSHTNMVTDFLFLLLKFAT